MFEPLNWFIFDVVAAISAVLGLFALIVIWGYRNQVTDPEPGALHGLYALTAAVGVDACAIALARWVPDSVVTGYISGVRVIYILTLVEYGAAVVILGIALIAVGRRRTTLARDVRIGSWILLSINLLGGALFLISEMKS